jgi:hypothetical protein
LALPRPVKGTALPLPFITGYMFRPQGTIIRPIFTKFKNFGAYNTKTSIVWDPIYIK